MRVSLSWIHRLLAIERLPLQGDALRNALTRSVAEIGALHRSGPQLDHIVVGQVLSVAQHPNADRLRTTTVDVGGRIIPVVCGAPNVAVGQCVCVALPGAQVTVPGKDGTPTRITIKTGKLRGEPSDGMLCAADELGLPGGHDGILVLDGSPAAGTPVEQVLGGGDTVLDIENIAVTHRADLWGHRGWAREIAALCRIAGPAELPTEVVTQGSGWSVRIDDPGCSTYLGAVISGVSDGPSPEWMVRGLESVGCRSLGRLVDVTNWVLFECGHPLHAFDAAAVPERSIVVRAGHAGESLAGLDGRTHVLADSDVVISDGARALALAGVLGGVGSGVSAATTSIVVESAVFAPSRIRRTRQRLSIATDAAARFEKTLQPESAAAAMHRAIALYAELCPGCTVTHRFHAGVTALPLSVIPFDPHAPERLAGIAIPADESVAHLARLGLESVAGGQRIPWWRRKDLCGVHDLCEEVLRFHGYDRITPAAPRLPMLAPAANPLRALEHRVRDAATALGWDEVVNYAFTSDAWADALGWAEGTRLRIAHPLSHDHTLMRQSLLPGLAACVAANRKHHAAVRLIEVGRRYARGIGNAGSDRVDERMTVAAVVSIAGEETPFYAARDLALGLAASLGVDATVSPAAAHPALVEGRCASISVGKRHLGVVGELPAAVRALAGLDGRVAWCELDLEDLLAALPQRPAQHRAPSRFQRVERDFTFVVADRVPFAELAAGCRQGAGALFDGATLVDVYRGQPIAAGHAAISLRVALQAMDRTLDDKELTAIQQRIISTVSQRCGATLRG